MGCRLIAPFDNPETGAIKMTVDDVQQLVEDYVTAAVRAQRAGFDGVEVHGAHGFLLAQFLDQRNQRHDAFGGTLDHRMQALVEVLEGIRAATGDGFQVGVRLSPEAKGSSPSAEVVSSRPMWRRRSPPVRDDTPLTQPPRMCGRSRQSTRLPGLRCGASRAAIRCLAAGQLRAARSMVRLARRIGMREMRALARAIIGGHLALADQARALLAAAR